MSEGTRDSLGRDSPGDERTRDLPVNERARDQSASERARGPSVSERTRDLLAMCGRDRGVSAVVAKTLEAGIVVLYVSMLVSVLYGGVVPEYRAAAGDELGERVLAEAAVEIQTAVPEDRQSEATVRHELPTTIESATYRITAENDSLVLRHDDPAIENEVPLVLPADVVRVEGTWASHEPAAVRVEQTDAGRIVWLESGGD